MIIEKVEIKNFRSIREQTIELDKLTALIGRNGAGKSSFLEALDFFYNISASISPKGDDFFNHDIGATIEIRVTYGRLRDDEKKEFDVYIRDEQLMVTKKAFLQEGKVRPVYYASARQIPQFAKIREMPGLRDRTNAFKELIDSGELPGLKGPVKSADEAEALMKEYEESHPELREAIDKVVEFFGPPNIGGGKLDKYTRFVLVPAVREATDEATERQGSIYKILDMIVLRGIEARKDIQDFKYEFKERALKIYSSENIKELPLLGESISKTLKRFAPGSELRLKWGEPKIPDIPPPEAMPTLIEDNFEGPISKKGHGLQRALILTLLQYLAMTIFAHSQVDESQEETPRKQFIGPDLILAIEEPELYLHPSRCRYLAEVLSKLTDDPALGARNQLLYATHSPYFVDLELFGQIRMIRKIPSPDSAAPQSVVSSFSLEEARREHERVCRVDPDSFTDEGFRSRATSIMNAVVNEGFFAEAVVVVEGVSDVGALWQLQQIMGKDWAEKSIAVVPAGGKNNLDRPVIIFRGLEIPTYFIFDGDIRFKGEKGKEKDAINRNRKYLCLANEPPEDFPRTQVKDSWAVLEDCPETEYKKMLGDELFIEIRDQVAFELGYVGEAERVLKNIEGSARFIELVYERGKSIPVLEEIVERITVLI